MSLIKKYWKIIVIVLIISGGIVWGFSYFENADSETTTKKDIQTATVRQGNILVSANGGGVVIPSNEVDLSFSGNGVLAELTITVGQKVNEGDLLARLGNLATLEGNLATAKLNLLKSQQALESIYDNAAAETANAQLAVANAKINLEDAISENLGVQSSYRLSYSASIASLEADLIIAQNNIDKALEAYQKVENRGDDDIQKALAYSKLQGEQDDYDAVLRNLNWYYGTPSDSDQAVLDAEIAAAEAAYETALAAFEVVKDGIDSDKVALAEAELENSKVSLLVAQENLAGASIFAPFDATVLAINVDVGESVGSGTIVTIANLDNPLIEIYLDESDFNMIDLNYPVEIVFDTYPDDIFSGFVIQVDPRLITVGNSPAVRGIVSLDEEFAQSGIKLLIGSNASVEVIAGQAEQTILVPIESLREITPGNYSVFVMIDGEPELRFVEVGLIDFTFAEILAGLDAGEIVTTGIVETE